LIQEQKSLTYFVCIQSKLNIDDTNRVDVAIEHYEPYIDFEELLRRTTATNSSFNEPGYVQFEQLKRT